VRNNPTHIGRDLQILPDTGDLNSFAIVVLVMVIGVSAYLWWTGRLRSRAGLLTIGAIILFLVYIAFYSNQPPA
jgi:hypothetical protein